eukprot:1049788-Prorocentrum_minimum.AAC.3
MGGGGGSVMDKLGLTMRSDDDHHDAAADPDSDMPGPDEGPEEGEDRDAIGGRRAGAGSGWAEEGEKGELARDAIGQARRDDVPARAAAVAGGGWRDGVPAGAALRIRLPRARRHHRQRWCVENSVMERKP